MAKDLDDFEDKIKKVIEGKLPDLTEEGYKVALSRDMEKTGKQLIKVYEKVLKDTK